MNSLANNSEAVIDFWNWDLLAVEWIAFIAFSAVLTEIEIFSGKEELTEIFSIGDPL